MSDLPCNRLALVYTGPRAISGSIKASDRDVDPTLQTSTENMVTMCHLPRRSLAQSTHGRYTTSVPANSQRGSQP